MLKAEDPDGWENEERVLLDSTEASSTFCLSFSTTICSSSDIFCSYNCLHSMMGNKEPSHCDSGHVEKIHVNGNTF